MNDSLAVIADVYANLEALDAVLAHAAARGVHDAICLGNVLGPGPDPRACVERVLDRCRIVLGNGHDRAPDPWTRSELGPALLERVARWARRHQEAGAVFETRDGDYLAPDAFRYGPTEHTERVFASFESTYFTPSPFGVALFATEEAVAATAGSLDLASAGRTIVWVPSVGRAGGYGRDAGYVTVEGDVVRWHRVPYDVARTVAKVRANPALLARHADRLEQGV